MRVTLLLTVLAIAVPVRPDISPREEVKPATPQLLGDWQLLKLSVGDKGMTDDADGSVLTFTSSDIQTRKKGERRPEEDASYRVDWTKMPATIDIRPKNGGGEASIGGILKIEADQLTICFTIGGPDAARPRDFVVAPNAQTVLVQLKRITK